jgi:hypothetical protein
MKHWTYIKLQNVFLMLSVCLQGPVPKNVCVRPNIAGVKLRQRNSYNGGSDRNVMKWWWCNWRLLVGNMEIKITLVSETQHMYWWIKLGHRYRLDSSFGHCTYHVYKDLGSNAYEILRISSAVWKPVIFALLMEMIYKVRCWNGPKMAWYTYNDAWR